MKNFFLFFILFGFHHFLSHGQYALLKFNINDCARCLSVTDSIMNTQHKVPVFIIFPEYDLGDRKEIIQVLGDTAGLKVPILFDNALYEKLIKYPISGFYYFNNQDEMVFFKTIDKLHISDMLIVDSLYKDDYKFKTKRLTHLNRLIEGINYEYNLQTGVITVENNPNYRIKITAEIENQIIDTLKLHRPGFYDLSELDQREKGVKERHYHMKENYFDVWNGQVFVPVSSGYLVHEGADTLTMVEKLKDDDHLFIDNFMALVKFDKEKVLAIYPCNDVKSSIEGRYTNLIKVINDTTFLVDYASFETLRSGFTKNKEHFLMGIYVLRNGQLVFKKRLNLDVPDYYKDFNLRTSDFSFVAFDYPYLAANYGHAIYNLKEEKVYLINPLFQKDAAQIIYFSPLNADTSMRGKVIRNDHIFFDAQKHRLYLFSRIANEGYYLSIIDAIKMKELETIKLSSINIPFINTEFPFVSIDDKNDLIYLEDDNKKVRSYPLELILSLSKDI